MEILKKTIVLTIVTSIAAMFLAVTYSNTKPRIDACMKNEMARLRQSVLPGSSGFEEIKIRGKNCYIGSDAENMKCGLVLPVSVKGYGGDIRMLLGVDLKGRIAGLQVIDQKETPGLGNRIALPDFTGRFTGLTEIEAVLKRDAPAGRIDAITAATISSRAVTGGVKQGFNFYNEYMNYISKNEILNDMPDGFYRGSGEGFTGPIRVEVKIKDERIETIRIINQQESRQFWAKVKSEIPGNILDAQTTDIDTVSGATLTSQGLLDAVQDALESAARKGR